VAHPQIAVFARLAKENSTPNRRIFGQATMLSRTMHDIRYDEKNDEFFVGNPFAQAILAFRGAATGEEAPRRVIQGSRTELIKPDNLDVDPVNNEIIVPEPETNAIMIYPRGATGNVAPVRVLHGREHGWSVGAVAVDAVHDLLVGAGSYEIGGMNRQALLVFNRTDQGSVKPLRVIGGPRSGLGGTRQIQAYGPGGWIIVSHPGRGDGEMRENVFIGVWSVFDEGDVPPRWRIGGADTRLDNPRGVVLNARRKEVVVADMGLNKVLTYSFPELFAAAAIPSAAK
jgi:hypothetical protein